MLLRLTEDVVVFQTVDATRRRDLYQSITANMETIFDFLAQLLEQQVQVASNYRLARCVLQGQSLIYCILFKSFYFTAYFLFLQSFRRLLTL